MPEPSESLQVEVDGATAAYLRRRCTDRAGMAAAAAAALHDLAIAEAAAADARWQVAHEAEIIALVEDGEVALADAV